VDHLVRRVVVHPDFFEHDLLFFGDLARVEGRMQEHVAENVDGERDVTVDHLGVVAGRLFIRERVEVAAHAVHRFGDGSRRAPLRPFEQHVLDQMRDAALCRSFRGRADVGPDAQ
jgi:hypothetical protein